MVSSALAHPEETRLGRQFDNAGLQHGGKSGFRIIPVGADGFLLRMQMINAAERTLDLQYFIFRGDETGRLLTDAVLRAADRAVRVRILTNSLESSSVLMAQAGYMHYRVPLLEDGVELYEIRSLLGNARGSGQSAAIPRYGNYSLHAKLFVFDRQRLFIGSMNFDQRSMHLNTEIGLIIDSPELAQQVSARFDAMAQLVNSYRLALRRNDAGEIAGLLWRSQEGSQTLDYDVEPARSGWQRIKVNFLSLLPLDKEL